MKTRRRSRPLLVTNIWTPNGVVISKVLTLISQSVSYLSLFFFITSFSNITIAISSNAAQLTVNFPELTSVHTEVLLPDGIEGVASGRKVTQKNWKNHQAVIEVPSGTYDLNIKKGATNYVVDNVDCTGSTCVVTDIVATLTVNFPGLYSVHTNVHVPDDNDGTTSGKEVTYAHWKSNQAEIPVLRQVYDLSIEKGHATQVVDNVDCTSGSCTVDGLTATMTIDFPGLSNVATTVHLPDEVNETTSGNIFLQTNWKKDKAVVTVFPQVYDLEIEKAGATIVIDDVDCTSGACTVDELTATMIVDFPGLSSVHTTALLSDGIDGRALGDEFTISTWKDDQAVLTVFPQRYDLKVQRGSSTHIIDNVDCSAGHCTVDGLAATMALNFPGLTSVHTVVRSPDGIDGEASGNEITKSTWKNDETTITLFPQVYDLEIQKGSATHIVDNVDCTTGVCDVDGLTATLIVNFPGLSSVHTTVLVPDGINGSVFGGEVTHANWKDEQAVLTVLPEIYDLTIKKGAATTVIDAVDCSSGSCTVDDLTALLTVEFPGMAGVHTAVLVPDGVNGTATGGELSHANSQSQKVTIPVFRQMYDVSVDHDIVTIYDNVDCTSGSCTIVIEGNVQITLTDGDNDIPLPNLRIDAYEKLPDDSLTRVQKRTTNEGGKAHFTLPGVGTGKIYVLRVRNPFGNDKKYYSPFLSNEGPFEFRITRDGEYPLDLVPPQVNITTPVEGNGVSVTGFEVKGYASDDNHIESVLLTVEDVNKGRSVITAQYEEGTGIWIATVIGSMISENSNIVLTATAIDRAHNKTSESIAVSGIVDEQGPQIAITSHERNATVPVTGFLLSGTVTDETMVANLFATLEDPVRGKTIENHRLDVAVDSGLWTLVVSNGLTSEGSVITINFVAQDIENNSSTATIQFQVVAEDNLDRHMINRITFGPTPQLVKEVQEMGAIEFLNQQLSPDSIDDSEFESLISGFQPSSIDELKAYAMRHMMFSKRQLQEVMTWFWDNHFSTDIDKEGNRVSYELTENEQFRANALGNFRDLLEISAKSPAMLYYLDSVSNTATDSNENYAREILELHTMGVDGGYTSSDIEAGAEIFTGWQVRNNAFFFNSSVHNFDPQLFLGEEIPPGGVEQGDQLIDILVAHRSTAEFISRKFVTLLVSDTPPESVVQRAADRFQIALNDDDQIAQVLREILTSPEFTASYRTKIKTPVELVVGFARNLSANITGIDLHTALESMGMELFENPLPTGWSETGDDWINSNLLLERIKWVNQVANFSQIDDTISIEPIDFFRAHGFETAEGIIGFLMKLAFGNDFTDLELSIAAEVLNEGEPFLLASADADQKLRTLVGTVLSFPGYQYQ